MDEARHIVDALPGMIWTAHPDGRIDFLNQRWVEYTGISIADSCGRGWQAAVHADDLQPLLKAWADAAAGGSAGETEARLRRADGVFRWFELRSHGLPDASGRWCGFASDIDERRKADEALRASERRFRLIVDGFPAHVSLRTPAGDLELVNRRFVEYSGTTLEQLKARPWHDTWHPDDRPGARAAWSASLDTGQPCEFEGRRRRADGEHRWFRMNGLPLRDADDRIVLWYLLQTDIEDRKRAEALLEAERRLLGMVASGDSLALVLDTLCRLVEDIVTGCHCSVRLANPGEMPARYGVVPAFPVRWSTPIASTRGTSLGTFSIHDRDAATPAPIHPDLFEQFTHVAGIAIERAQAEVALSKARSDLARVARVTTLGALTASIAHEVNQPLSGIITNAGTCLRMLGAEPPNLDGARETARRTIRDGNRASEVITRLRALFVNKDTASDTVDLNDATREVIALSGPELQRGRVITRVELAEDLPAVTGDRIQLQQVVLNIVMNAADAMSTVDDRPRELVIRTAPDEGDRVRLTIQDAGIGLDQRTAEQLFEAFYTTKSGGMGIGLSISRSIIESHRGRLWAAANKGPGATFAFTIPRRPNAALPAAGASSAAGGPAGHATP